MARRELQIVEGNAHQIQTKPLVAGGKGTVSGLLDGVKQFLTKVELESGKETVRLFKAARCEPSDLRALAVGVKALGVEQINRAVENGTLPVIDAVRQEIKPLTIIQSKSREGSELSIRLRLAPMPKNIEQRAVDRRMRQRMAVCAGEIKAAQRQSGFTKEVTGLVKDSGIRQGYRRSLELIALDDNIPEDVIPNIKEEYDNNPVLIKLLSIVNL